MSLFSSFAGRNATLAMLAVCLPFAEIQASSAVATSSNEILASFDLTCRYVKDFEQLKASMSTHGWSSMDIKSERKIALANRLAFRNTLKIEKMVEFEYKTEVNRRIFLAHIERVEYVGGKFSNRCAVYDFNQSTPVSATRLRAWQGREADRVLDRPPYAIGRIWLELPDGSPRIQYVFRKGSGGGAESDKSSTVPTGTYIQTEHSGLRQKV